MDNFMVLGISKSKLIRVVQNYFERPIGARIFFKLLEFLEFFIFLEFLEFFKKFWKFATKTLAGYLFKFLFSYTNI